MLSAVLGVAILSVHPSVRHTRALWLIQRTYRRFFIPHERAIILVFWCQRCQRNSNGVTHSGGAKDRWGRLKWRFSTNIPWTADRLRRCQLSSTTVSVIIFWRSAAMLITSTVEICIRHLGRVEEMVFAARRSYASTVLGVVILSVCHTRAFWPVQRTYRRYFYTTWKGNPYSQMWFFVQLCSSWQDFNWLKGSRGLSAAAELLVLLPFWQAVLTAVGNDRCPSPKNVFVHLAHNL